MNLNLDSLKNKIFGYVRYGSTIRPQRDWFVLLSIVAILLVASAALNALRFVKVENGQALDTAAAPSSAPAANTASLDAVTALFQARAQTATAYETGPRLVDPSK